MGPFKLGGSAETLCLPDSCVKNFWEPGPIPETCGQVQRHSVFAPTFVGLRLTSSLRKMSVLLTPGSAKKSFCPRIAAARSPEGI